MRQPEPLVWVSRHRATIESIHGDFDAADREMMRSLDLARRVGAPDAALIFASQRFSFRFMQGRLGELAERMAARKGDGWFPAVWAHWSLLNAEVGDLDEAADSLQRQHTIDFWDYPNGHVATSGIAAAVLAAARLSDGALLERVLPVLGAADGFCIADACYWWGPVAHYQGITWPVLGDLDRAVEHLEAAIRLERDLEAWPWLAPLARRAVASIGGARPPATTASATRRPRRQSRSRRSSTSPSSRPDRDSRSGCSALGDRSRRRTATSRCCNSRRRAASRHHVAGEPAPRIAGRIGAAADLLGEGDRVGVGWDDGRRVGRTVGLLAVELKRDHVGLVVERHDARPLERLRLGVIDDPAARVDDGDRPGVAGDPRVPTNGLWVWPNTNVVSGSGVLNTSQLVGHRPGEVHLQAGVRVGRQRAPDGAARHDRSRRTPSAGRGRRPIAGRFRMGGVARHRRGG